MIPIVRIQAPLDSGYYFVFAFMPVTADTPTGSFIIEDWMPMVVSMATSCYSNESEMLQHNFNRSCVNGIDLFMTMMTGTRGRRY